MEKTFFQQLAEERFPPEVQTWLSKKAVSKAEYIVIKGERRELEVDWFPTLGTDKCVRGSLEFGAQGIGPELAGLLRR